MAMKVCKECGTEVSKGAKACPKCGKDQRNFFLKHKVLTFILAVILIGIIVGASGDSNNNITISSDNSEKTSTSTSSVEQKERKVKVGESVQTDEVKISYKSSKEYTKYNSYSKPKSGNKVIRVEFQFENISNSDVYLSNMDCYADGEKCESYYYANDYKSPTLESLSKGKKVKAVLYYEVPKKAKEITLEYETNYWTDEKVEFVVK